MPNFPLVRTSTALVALTTLVLLSSSSAVGSSARPEYLFSKLQAVPVHPSELPAGYHLPPASEAPHPGFPTAWSRSHPIPWRAGGAELAFALRGPDRAGLLGYTVYQTEKQALAALRIGPKAHHFGFAPPDARLLGRVPGYPASTLWQANAPGAIVLEADVVSGFVTVRSLTVVTGKAGDVPGSVALVAAGLKHLAAVEQTMP